MTQTVPPQHRRALIVDDDASIRKMLVKLLERERFQVECAKDGAEAIEMIGLANYAVILLDLMMPRVDGQTVLAFMRTQRPDLVTRVIVMTAFAKTAVESFGPICAAVTKPFDIYSMVELVHRCAVV